MSRLHATQPDQINSTPVLGEVEETDCDQSTVEKGAPQGKTRGRRAGYRDVLRHTRSTAMLYKPQSLNFFCEKYNLHLTYFFGARNFSNSAREPQAIYRPQKVNSEFLTTRLLRQLIFERALLDL